MTTVVEVVEVDVPRCVLTYGVAPCEAVLGVTGDRKCFNTLATCQDRENFSPGVLTLRFFRASAEPEIFDGLAVLDSVEVTPQVLDPGNSLGQRESVSVVLQDFQHSDAGVDPYLPDRGYDAYPRGTFWGRFRARVPAMRGAALRVRRGESGQPLSTFETWHYVVETTTGPAGGRFSITAKDALKYADKDRAVAPRPSPGQLAAPVAAGAGSATLSPVGIGDLHYPAAGLLNLGGTEVVEFTRSGDTLTLTDRGAENTPDVSHDAGERAQVCLQYVAQRPDEIIFSLLFDHTDLPGDWIDPAAWQAEIEAFTPRLYSATIAEPTPVDDLINELIAQVGLVMWTDTKARRLRLIGLRAVGTDAAVINADRQMVGSYSSKEQPGKRVSTAITYFGLRNPLLDVDDQASYGNVSIALDPSGADQEYGGEAIRTTYSRWINAFNRQAAERVNSVLLSRFRDPPRRLTWDNFITDTAPQVGAGVYIQHHELQDDTGAELLVPVQVLSLEARDDRYRFTGEQQPPAAVDEVTEDKVIYIDADGYNLDLRTIYDSLYSAPTMYDTVTFIIGETVKIGTRKGDNGWAIKSGLWPELTDPPTLRNLGRILGRGGDGGTRTAGSDGKDAEHALHAQQALRVENLGIIGGGGGGGGSGYGGGVGGGIGAPGGGGGQGFEGSLGGGSSVGSQVGNPGTPDAPGQGKSGPGDSGDGGTLGQDGQDRFGDGGEGGAAVHGDDLIDWLALGTVLGARLDSTDPLP